MEDEVEKKVTPVVEPFFSPLSVSFTVLLVSLFVNRFIKAASCACRPQGSVVQEERNGPVAPAKPREPSLNHTVPAPGEHPACRFDLVCHLCLWLPVGPAD